VWKNSTLRQHSVQPDVSLVEPFRQPFLLHLPQTHHAVLHTPYYFLHQQVGFLSQLDLFSQLALIVRAHPHLFLRIGVEAHRALTLRTDCPTCISQSHRGLALALVWESVTCTSVMLTRPVSVPCKLIFFSFMSSCKEFKVVCFGRGPCLRHCTSRPEFHPHCGSEREWTDAVTLFSLATSRPLWSSPC